MGLKPGYAMQNLQQEFFQMHLLFSLEAQSTQPCPAQLSISLSSPGELGRATLP